MQKNAWQHLDSPQQTWAEKPSVSHWWPATLFLCLTWCYHSPFPYWDLLYNGIYVRGNFIVENLDKSIHVSMCLNAIAQKDFWPHSMIFCFIWEEVFLNAKWELPIPSDKRYNTESVIQFYVGFFFFNFLQSWKIMASAVSKVKRQIPPEFYNTSEWTCSCWYLRLFKIVFKVYYIYQRCDRVTAHIYVGQWTTWNWFYPSTLWVP